MKKIVEIDTRAKEEFDTFSYRVQTRFGVLIEILERKGRLELPKGKKIGRNLFEIRVKVDGEYRGFYAYILNGVIVILHFFRKKSQKIPLRDIKLAERRLSDYKY